MLYLLFFAGDIINLTNDHAQVERKQHYWKEMESAHEILLKCHPEHVGGYA